MTTPNRRPAAALPETPPPSISSLPRMRYWGDRQPPKNRVDMFNVRVHNAADDDGAGGADSGGSVATIRMYGPIDSWGGFWGISARDVAEALDQLAGADEIRVRINSPGGEVWEGMAILNMLRAHPAKIVAVVDGLAASAASVVAVGCDETVMSPGTQMMVHDASGFAWGNEATMLKAARWLASTSDAIASVYAEAAGGTDQSWRAVMIDETWYTAKEAVAAGLADRVAVVPDAGDTTTAGEDTEPLDDDVEDRFDLSMYLHPGRSNAPAPPLNASDPRDRPSRDSGPTPVPTAPGAAGDGSTTTQERSPAVAFTDEQLTTMRQELGLPADADEATITAALVEALAERADPPPAGSSLPDGVVPVDSERLANLERDSQAGRAALERQQREDRERLVAQAVADGRIPPARRDHHLQQLELDPGYAAVLEAMPKGLIPVDDTIGHEGTGDGDPAAADNYWFPGVPAATGKGA